ncbi:MAG: type I glutamate--ammonia ligase, partial [Christensenellales bacterium]
MPSLTREDVLRLAQEHAVRFIRLQFTDIFGTMKNVTVTTSQLEKAL